MHTFTVWAPKAQKLVLELDGKPVAMQQAEHGWWNATVQDVAPGSRYAYRVNDGPPVPDPRSNFQPEGIHGPSQLVDHSAFEWSDANWQPQPLGSAIIYELHIGTFTPEGTFLSALDRLEYLKELGITHIEIMPVNEFSGPRGWGYDGVDLYAPHHQYGTPDDLKTLVDEAHRIGLAVILDVVYNHFGPVGNYLGMFGHYLTANHRTPWGDAVNLDSHGSHEVRKFFYENALMWLRDYHFDGLRLDAVHAFIDTSAFHFLEHLSTQVDALSSRLGKYKFLIAESDLNDPRIVTSREANGYGIDAQWADDLHHAIHAVLTEEKSGYYEDFGSLACLAKALKTPFVYDGLYSLHRQRHHGRPPIGLNGHHFVVCTQNHDQVGNRAVGERLSQMISMGRQKIAAALILTSAYVPMLFQGEEYGAATPFLYFSSHEDEELGKAVSEGRQNEFKAFGWQPDQVPDPQLPETFERSKLNWKELDQPQHAEILAWHRQLIAMRRECGFTDGQLERMEVSFDEEARWLVIRRGSSEIAINLARHHQVVPLSERKRTILCSADSGWKEHTGGIELPPDSVAIVTADLTSHSTPGQLSRSAFG